MCNRLYIIVLLGGLLLNGCDSQVSRFKEKVAVLSFVFAIGQYEIHTKSCSL